MSEHNQYIDYLKTIDNVDQVEFNAVRLGSSVFAESLIDEHISGEIDDEATTYPHDESDWAIIDNIEDSEVGNVIQEIQNRKEILGDLYPFTIQGNSIFHNESESLVYEYCLSTTQVDFNGDDLKCLPRIFEELASKLTCSFMVGSKEWRTGHPNQVGNIEKHINIIREETGEWKWSPKDYSSTKGIKDGGIDFMVWKKPPGYRSGGLFIIGQCACGNNWNTKFNDIDINRLKSLLEFPLVSPIKVFSTPYLITNELYNKEITNRAGMFLERTRLTFLADIDYHSIKSYNNKLRELIDSALNSV